jgi:hypothetical protein
MGWNNGANSNQLYRPEASRFLTGAPADTEAFGANSDFLHEVNILLLCFVRHSQPNHGDEWKHTIFAVLAGLEDLLQLVEKGAKDGALMSSKEVLQLAAEQVGRGKLNRILHVPFKHDIPRIVARLAIVASPESI